MEVELTIKAIFMLPRDNSAVVMLREEPGSRELPIRVGPLECRAIGLQVENYEPPRPLTHDLIRELLRELDARVVKVVIHDLRRNTFYAHIHLERKRRRLAIDARPSDAIAIALRTRAPIYAHKRVIERGIRTDEELIVDTEPPEDSEALADWLESLDEEDLGDSQ